MKFSDRFPNAHEFEEVLDGLFCVVDHSPCHWCTAPTKFLDFSFTPTKPMCSEECLVLTVEKQHGKSMGLLEELRQLKMGRRIKLTSTLQLNRI